jgi:hypothetical protein
MYIKVAGGGGQDQTMLTSYAKDATVKDATVRSAGDQVCSLGSPECNYQKDKC